MADFQQDVQALAHTELPGAWADVVGRHERIRVLFEERMPGYHVARITEHAKTDYDHVTGDPHWYRTSAGQQFEVRLASDKRFEPRLVVVVELDATGLWFVHDVTVTV